MFGVMRLATTSSAAVLKPALPVKPLAQGGRALERLFLAVCKPNRKFLVCFDRSVSRVARVGFEPTGTKD